MKQLVEKQNCLEYLEDQGYIHEKHPHHCTICGQVGHNRHLCNTSPDNIQHTRAEQKNHNYRELLQVKLSRAKLLKSVQYAYSIL